MREEQQRITHYLTKEFKAKELSILETLDYFKMELQKRENALFENIRIRELETKLKEFSNDALIAKSREECNKK